MARFARWDAEIRQLVEMTDCAQPFPRSRGARSFFAPGSSLLVVAMEPPWLRPGRQHSYRPFERARRMRRKLASSHPRA